MVDWLFGFYDISTFVGYLMPNSVYIYIYIYIYTFNLRFLNEYSVDKFYQSRISFVYTRLNGFNSSYFWSNPVSLNKDRSSSILAFSNRSLKLFTLKNRFLMRAKSRHSMRTCLMLQCV